MPLYKNKLFWPVMTLLIAVGGYFMHEQYRTVTLSTGKINANPAVLDGAIMKGGESQGLALKDITLTGTKFTEVRLQNPVFENVVFVDAKFDEMDMRDVRFTNVHFKNCSFINAHMRGGEFTDVTFTGGRFAYRGDVNNWYNPTYITEMHFSNVVFDAVEMDSPRIDGVSGSVTLKNLTKLRFSRNGSLINGSGLVLRVDNCHISGNAFAAMFSGSTAYVTNSTFRSSGFLGENSKAMYFENCKLLDGSSILDAETLVIKNSTVCARFYGRGTWYFEGCEFVIHSVKSTVGATLDGEKESRSFLLGSKSKAPWVGIRGGTVYAFDTVFENLKPFANLPNFPPKPITAINLRNVAIHGGIWENFTMRGGQ